MTVLIHANPFRCRMWEHHDRLEGEISEKSCVAEIQSISTHGQIIPALARALPNDPEHQFELIYGARRLFVARHLNAPILLEVRPLSDREAVVAMDIENRHRKDVSAYERGMSYARWLRCGFFSSQEEIARQLKNSPAAVSRLLKLAGLPSVVVSAFADVTLLRESWGVFLSEALQNPDSRRRIIAKARSIQALECRPEAESVYRQLVSAASGLGTRERRARDEVYTDHSGKVLFRVKVQRHAVAIVVPKRKLSQRALQRVCGAVHVVLQDGIA